ncbi:UDP-N-acetylglucosamine 2-epimerase (non-hydrolyzing) [Methanocella sp. CWC-04]|uniref:UDP-N-acetylglucosamine 2-epimerase (Non-hydrolyzing) n=1 Tax=Methanooceanicella nereidis TaxID=2052831 RepID=A0AAP2RCT1_9EURY|nr:UDP-N-acetylglucosamine 2-epimerase (non-hydrolyzing) [Methanocella sp. CWC-04]MCD1294909.1 UDP-N-acetylglucosamine 2-epimerase (non-hydrolyzing) [Methanocella sp. CWC-04]
MKIVTVVGARPQFIKCAPVSREIRKEHMEILVHTGQHYDHDMSDIFFEELGIPKPDYNLGVGSASHGKQTGEMLAGIETILIKEKPDIVLVYGDTNSTIAGALAASKLQIKIVHVEAGLRSFDRTMPEEINRVVTDHLSDILFCPTKTSEQNLLNEGIINGVHYIGDVMVDALAYNLSLANEKSKIISKLNIENGKYLVVTIHRPNNTDEKSNLVSIIESLIEANKKVIFPVHPRTKKYLINYGLFEHIQKQKNIELIEPLGYLDMLQLMANSDKIITDSGGIQKEAYMLKIPCITIRDKTEWIETLDDNWNILTGSNKNRIIEAIKDIKRPKSNKNIFGDVGVSKKIRNLIKTS